MLTIQDINDVSFRKANFSGYNSDDVDQFIDEVLETVTALTREAEKPRAAAKPQDPAEVADLKAKNAELKEKLAVLAEKVEAYRAEEDSIKDAILSAKRLGSASIREAKAKADTTISEANAKAESVLADARAKADALLSDARAKAQMESEANQAKIADQQRELDFLKRKVSEFRSSLYEMYRQHLALIEHMPEYTAPAATPAVPAPAEQPKQPPVEQKAPAPQPVQPQPAPEEDEEEEIPVPAAAREEEVQKPAEPVTDTPAAPEPEPEAPVSERDAYIQEQFGGIHLDLDAYGDIPETLQKEKESRFSSLDYGIEDEGKKGKFKRK